MQCPSTRAVAEPGVSILQGLALAGSMSRMFGVISEPGYFSFESGNWTTWQIRYMFLLPLLNYAHY